MEGLELGEALGLADGAVLGISVVGEVEGKLVEGELEGKNGDEEGLELGEELGLVVGRIEGELVVGDVEGTFVLGAQVGAELGLADGIELGRLVMGEVVGSPFRLHQSYSASAGAVVITLLCPRPQQTISPVFFNAHVLWPALDMMPMKLFPAGEEL